MSAREVLTLKYRPQSFDDLVEQGVVKVLLTKIIETEDVPNSLVFAGSRGTGKTTSARIFAAALNCLAPEAKPCGSCPQCTAVRDGSSIDVLEIDAASNGSVAEIRKIKDSMSYQHSGKWRVVILDEAHSMSREAFNALLKVLEEPPPHTVFVLATTEPTKIIGTVLSRSMTFEFKRMSLAGIANRLDKIRLEEGIDASPELLAMIAERAQGGMRDAIMMLDQCGKAGISTVDQFNEMHGITDISIDLLTAAVNSSTAEGYALIEQHFFRAGDATTLVNDLTALVGDLLIIKAGGNPRGTAAEADRKRDLAGRASMPNLVAVMKVLWDLRMRSRHTDNDQRASMEMAFVLILDALGATATTNAARPTQQASRPLSLQAMVAMGGQVRAAGARHESAS